jgi:hypothetical protein
MAASATKDPFSIVREAGTTAPNFDLDNDEIVQQLAKWQSQCAFQVTEATGDTVNIEFTTLPPDLDAFARELYAFCPDTVDQGTGCMHEMVESMEEMGEELSPEIAQLIDGIDFSDENYGVEILKRQIEQCKSIQLWWD